MSYARVYSRALLGIDAPSVSVEVHASRGIPGLSIFGLLEASVRESKERVRSTLESVGFSLPPTNRCCSDVKGQLQAQRIMDSMHS